MQVKSKRNKGMLVEPDDILPEFVGSQSAKANESKEKSSKELYPMYKSLLTELYNRFIKQVVYFFFFFIVSVAQKLNLQISQNLH